MKTLSLRMCALLAAVAWLAAACAGNPSSTTGPASTSPAPLPTETSMMMQMPPYAKDMKISITSPTNGIKVTDNAITLQVAVTGYTSTCALAGKESQAGTGHYHILLDKALANMFSTSPATISLH